MSTVLVQSIIISIVYQIMFLEVKYIYLFSKVTEKNTSGRNDLSNLGFNGPAISNEMK